MKSYQEQILEVVEKQTMLRAPALCDAMKDCWTIARLEQEMMAFSFQEDIINDDQKAEIEQKEEQIAAILAKYGIKP